MRTGNQLHLVLQKVTIVMRSFICLSLFFFVFLAAQVVIGKFFSYQLPAVGHHERRNGNLKKIVIVIDFHFVENRSYQQFFLVSSENINISIYLYICIYLYIYIYIHTLQLGISAFEVLPSPFVYLHFPPVHFKHELMRVESSGSGVGLRLDEPLG